MTLKVVRLNTAHPAEARRTLHTLAANAPSGRQPALTVAIVDAPLPDEALVTDLSLQRAEPGEADPADPCGSDGPDATLEVPPPPGSLVTASRWEAGASGVPDSPSMAVLEGLRRLLGHPRVAAVPIDAERVANGARTYASAEDGEDGQVAMAVASLPRWAAANPARASEHAILEACRHLVLGGFQPRALGVELEGTAPASYHALASRQALGETAAALGLPWIAHRTLPALDEPRRALPLAPLVAAVGVLQRGVETVPPWCPEPDLAIVLVGGSEASVEASLHLDLSFRKRAGAVPAAETADEQRMWALLERLHGAGTVRGARALTEGGLMTALVSFLVARGSDTTGEEREPLGGIFETYGLGRGRRDAALFGERSGRALLAVDPGDLPAVLAAAEAGGVPVRALGDACVQETLIIRHGMQPVSWRVPELAERWREAWAPPPSPFHS